MKPSTSRSASIGDTVGRWGRHYFNLPTFWQLALPAATVVLLGLAVSVASLLALRHTRHLFDQLYDRHVSLAIDLRKLDRHYAKHEAALRRHLASESAREMAELRTDITRLEGRLHTNLTSAIADYNRNGPTDGAGRRIERHPLTPLVASTRRYMATAHRALELSDDFEKERASQLVRQSARTDLKRIRASMDQAVAISDTQLKRARDTLSELQEYRTSATALATVVAALLSFAIALMVARHIAARVRVLASCAAALGEGHLSARADLGSNDEFGRLGRSLDQMSQRLSELFSELEAKNAALGETNQRLQAILDNSVAHICLKDRQGRYLMSNRSFDTAFAPKDGRIRGRLDAELFPENETEQMRTHDRRVLKTGSPLHVEQQITHANGTKRTYLSVKFPVLDDRETPYGVCAISTDISPRKRTENALRESEERYRDLFENASDLIQITDPSGCVSYANRVWRQTLGFTEAQLQAGAVRLEDFVHPDSLDDLRNACNGLCSDPAAPTVEAVFLTRSGEAICVEGTISCRTDNGRKISTRGIFRNVTERKHLDRMKSEFISVVSHELRTPLTSIRGSLGLLEGGVAGPIGAKAQSLVGIARNNSDRLIRLVNDILDLEKMEAGKTRLVIEPLSTREIIEPTLQDLEAMALEAGVVLQVAGDDLKLQGDRDRLVQVLTNLVGNAIKFSPRGSVIDVRADAVPAGQVRISVADNGPGIPKGQDQRLFSKFHQLDATDSRRRGGTGLGLAICKAIVEQHRGVIGVDAERQGGATFFFTLPSV